LFEAAKEQANATAEEVLRLTGIYWTKNLERRKDHDQHTAGYPVAYTSAVSLEIPSEFETLEWNGPRELVSHAGSAAAAGGETANSMLLELGSTES